MHCIVTGCAGFIGSHLSESLINKGHSVVGLDALTTYYPVVTKRANLLGILAGLPDRRGRKRFKFMEKDLLKTDLEKLFSDADYIFHLAAQPGVRKSWGADFGVYVRDNVLATQAVLEAAKSCKRLKKLVYASSSSVYGDAESFPIKEDNTLRPLSPYGVTKLAAENLCMAYWKSFGIPVVALRFFTVYGPRQRPDMAFNVFIKHMLEGKPLPVFHSGAQVRDFTFVSDAVNAVIRAAEAKVTGEAINVAGGSRVSVNHVIRLISGIIGTRYDVKYSGDPRGDVKKTWADTSKARKRLGFKPEVSLKQGLEKEIRWMEGKKPSPCPLPKGEGEDCTIDRGRVKIFR